jgi:hypothetical protein
VQEIDFVSPLGILFPVDQNWKIYNRDGARELNLEPDPSIAGFCDFLNPRQKQSRINCLVAKPKRRQSIIINNTTTNTAIQDH